MMKGMMILALMSSMALSCHAQDTMFPQADLYDSGMMNTYINAYRETAAARMRKFEAYFDLAIEAYNNRQWNYAIYYVNEALDTKYTNGLLYFIRGYSYEQLGKLKEAKDDYKTGKKLNCVEAARALESLEARSKYRK